jgi:uncharacterized protein YjbI with pentapeptide repeats
MSLTSNSSDGLMHLGQDEKRRVSRLTGRIKSVTEFLSDALDKLKDSHFPEAIGQAAPWAETFVGAAADAAADTILPIKFLVKLCEKITEINDPEELGHLACTIAFEHAAEQTIKEVGGPLDEKRAIKEAKEQLALLEPSEDVDLGAFTYEHALDHEFFKQAEVQLQAVLILIGYSGAQVDQISNLVKDRFVTSLKNLLVNRETAEKFTPFKEFIELGGADEKSAYKALAEHLKFQRWLFDEAPVLRKSPFALQHVYVETDCGRLTWGEINPLETHSRIRYNSEEQPNGQNNRDPFSEHEGGRYPLLQSVIDLIGESENREPIIIQGIAGAGKSSFTLRLCVELQRRQLRPILIRFKDIRFDRHVAEALPKAVRLSDEQRSPEGVPPTPKDLFRGGNIFRESGSGEYSKICRYILILDGWDEISVANEGFKHRVERILEQIRSEYIDTNTLTLPIRIIMTGRPSTDVNESGFLREMTPVLTIRPMTPEQLRKFITDLSKTVKNRPINLMGEDIWPEEFDPQKFEPIFKQYETDFNLLFRKQNTQADGKLREGSLGVLGLPLLAQLAARLISSWQGEPEQLINNPTTLYRNLVNLTCKKGGKDEADADKFAEVRNQSRIVGEELRQLLWKTAAAMTVYGKDLIPYEELSSRLEFEGDELDEQVSSATRENIFSALLISFYFKGGFRHTGCEFVHKSFREYLYAEALVEIIKDYGRRAPALLPERDKYWKEFGEDDLRFEFTREVARLFPQWLSSEVAFHLDHLIEWEIRRVTDSTPLEETGMTTHPLDVEGWKRVRDGLADLWDWWGEGVHLRPQPQKGKRRELIYEEPFIYELILQSLPLEAAPAALGPPRTTTLDSHLGYGLFTLCVLVHHYLFTTSVGSVVTSARTDANEVMHRAVRKYQSHVEGGEMGNVRFAPSKPERTYFINYAHRIASAGIRPNGWFPAFSDLRSVDLSGTDLVSVDFFGARLDHADLKGANLYRANLNEASFVRADCRGARLEEAELNRAVFVGANLAIIKLDRASLSGANLAFANLVCSSLIEVQASGGNFTRANFSEARLYGSSFHEANLSEADLRGAKLGGANLEYANLYGANLDGADLSGADLSRTNVLTRTQIANAVVDNATRLPSKWSDQSED